MGDDLQLGLKDKGEGRGHPRRGKWEGEGLHASCYGNEIFVLGCQGNFRHTLDTATIVTAPPTAHHSHTVGRALHTRTLTHPKSVRAHVCSLQVSAEDG